MLRSLPSFVNPDVYASERNTNGEGENATLGSESGSSAEKDDEVCMGVGAEETVASCVSLFYYGVYSSSFAVPHRDIDEHTPQHPERRLDDGELAHAIDMV